MLPPRRSVLALCTALAIEGAALAPLGPGHGTAQAEENGDAPGMSEGLGLIEEGARLFLRGLMDEMAPLFDELESMIDDLALYHPPEILPNGDIILRRRVPLEPDGPQDDPEAEPGEEIDI